MELKVIIGVIAYLFLFELMLSIKQIPITEKNLPFPFSLQHKLWMKFSHGMGVVMSKIILTILWIVGFGPYAIVWKFIHRDVYGRKESYWVEADYSKYDMKYPF